MPSSLVSCHPLLVCALPAALNDCFQNPLVTWEQNRGHGCSSFHLKGCSNRAMPWQLLSHPLTPHYFHELLRIYISQLHSVQSFVMTFILYETLSHTNDTWTDTEPASVSCHPLETKDSDFLSTVIFLFKCLILERVTFKAFKIL